MGPGATGTQTQFWTRTLSRTTQNNKPVIIVTQEWEDKDAVMHTEKSVCNETTLQPLTHKFWRKKRRTTSVNFENGGTLAVNGAMLNGRDTAKQLMAVWSAFISAGNNYFLNWHMDLEVFPAL